MITIDTIKLVLICISMSLSSFSMGMAVANLIHIHCFGSLKKRYKGDKQRGRSDSDGNPRNHG